MLFTVTPCITLESYLKGKSCYKQYSPPLPCQHSHQGQQMFKFYIKVFRTSLFPNPMMDLVHVWYDDRYWSKNLHSAIPTPIHDLKVKVTNFELLNFYIKVFRTSLFPNPMMDLVHVWYDDRYWSKNLHSAIPTLIHDLKIKVTNFELLKFYIKVFRTSLFQNPMMDLVHVWYDDRYWSKNLHSAIPTPIHDLKVKVTNFELLNFLLKFLEPHYFQTL